MTDQDRLAAIKTEWFGPDTQRSPRIRHGLAAHHVDWLVGEVERLRGLRQRLREIEWSASLPTYGEDCGHFSTEDGCPACEQSSLDGHASDCWLAAEL